jgi:hypothetical protein
MQKFPQILQLQVLRLLVLFLVAMLRLERVESDVRKLVLADDVFDVNELNTSHLVSVKVVKLLFKLDVNFHPV